MKIIECKQEEWDSFADSSKEGTVFCKSYYLKSYEKAVRHLLCLKGGSPFGGFSFVESGDSIRPMPFHVYSGIIFSDLSKLKTHKQNETKFTVTECFAEYLFNKYKEVSFINHWDVTDIRAFDWVNYHEKEKGHYKAFIRYTSQLYIENPCDTSNYQASRRQMLKKSEKYSMITESSSKVELLNRLHEKTFKRQAITRSPDEEKAVLNICENLIKNDSGRLFITYFDKKPASAAFWAYDKRRAYYLFGATDPEFRNYETGTKNMFDSFNLLNREIGVKEVDFVGVNSPQRGYFKLSFGGRIVPYYMIKKVLPRKGS